VRIGGLIRRGPLILGLPILPTPVSLSLRLCLVVGRLTFKSIENSNLTATTNPTRNPRCEHILRSLRVSGRVHPTRIAAGIRTGCLPAPHRLSAVLRMPASFCNFLIKAHFKRMLNGARCAPGDGVGAKRRGLGGPRAHSLPAPAEACREPESPPARAQVVIGVLVVS
jgi:hypothetical protein